MNMNSFDKKGSVRPGLGLGKKFTFRKPTDREMEKGIEDFKKNLLPIFKKLSKE